MVSLKVCSGLPKIDEKKYLELVHYIVHKVGEKENFSSTLLNKILYFCDFDFYELNHKSITNESYRKVQFGPIPCHIDKISASLISQGKVLSVKNNNYHGYKQSKLVCIKEPALIKLSIDERKIIDNVINKLSSMGAKQASEYSHTDTPWKVTKDKDLISYGLVFYRTDLTSVTE